MMRRILTIGAILVVSGSTMVITGLSQTSKVTATKAVEIKKLTTFESEFNKHISDLIRGNVEAAGQIWETKCYKDFYDKKLWNASAAAKSASCANLDRGQLQEVRDLVNRHLDDMYKAETSASQELEAFAATGKIGADFHTEKLYKP